MESSHGMIDLWLVRHAQPEWEPEGRAVDDPRLTELGRRQAEQLGKVLAAEHFDARYRSPVLRVEQTAAPLAQLGWDFEVCSWLAELGLPSLAGSTTEEVGSFFREARLRDVEQWWEGLPGGESFRHFNERVTAGIEGLLADGHRLRVHEDGAHRIWKQPERSERILILAHAGTNAVLTGHLLGIDPVPWSWTRFHSAHTGVTRLYTSPVGSGAVWVLSEFGSTRHLEGAPATW